MDYWEFFEQSRIVYPDITWRGSFSFDPHGRYFNNTVYFLPIDHAWLIAVLNSTLMWAFCWRNAAHGKDEVLRFFHEFVQRIPITNEARGEAVGRLMSLTRSEQEARRDTLDWLRVEFGVEKPGQKLGDFAALSPDAFVEEVRKRRSKGEGRLTCEQDVARCDDLPRRHVRRAPPSGSCLYFPHQRRLHGEAMGRWRTVTWYVWVA